MKVLVVLSRRPSLVWQRCSVITGEQATSKRNDSVHGFYEQRLLLSKREVVRTLRSPVYDIEGEGRVGF